MCDSNHTKSVFRLPGVLTSITYRILLYLYYMFIYRTAFYNKKRLAAELRVFLHLVRVSFFYVKHSTEVDQGILNKLPL